MPAVEVRTPVVAFAPGPPAGDPTKPNEWKCTGTADIVCYLAGRSVERGIGPDGSRIVEVLVESLEFRAFSYLRPASPEFLKATGRTWGVAAPFHKDRLVPPALAALARERGLPVEVRIAGEDPARPGCDWDKAIYGDVAPHVGRWQFVEVEDGIWAGRYV